MILTPKTLFWRQKRYLGAKKRDVDAKKRDFDVQQRDVYVKKRYVYAKNVIFTQKTWFWRKQIAL